MQDRIRIATLAFASLAIGPAAQALTFTNFVYSGSLSSGITNTTSGNSISFTTPNAYVGDPSLAPSRSGGFTIQYDALGNAMLGEVSVEINSTILGAVLGLGKIQFQEEVFELDGMGNEIGGPIASLSQTLDASSPSWSSSAAFPHPAQNVRAKKSFTLLAPDSVDPLTIDYASVQLVNQNFQAVPEPASMAALGIGALGVLRRRAWTRRSD